MADTIDDQPATTAKAPARRRSPSSNSAGAPKSTRRAAPKPEPTLVEMVADEADKLLIEPAKDAADAIAKAVAKPARAVALGARSATRSAKRLATRVTPSAGAGRATPSAKSPKPRGGASTGTILGVAAAGIAAGFVANLGRKAAVQAPSLLAGDWFEALKGEHKAALALFDAIEKTTDKQPAKRSFLLMQLKHALSKHAFTEENVIYPALRELGDPAEADKLNHEHGYVKDYLYQLDNIPNESPEFMATVSRFRRDLEKHILEEENEIFPTMHAKLGAEKNRTLTFAANKEGFKLA